MILSRTIIVNLIFLFAEILGRLWSDLGWQLDELSEVS